MASTTDIAPPPPPRLSANERAFMRLLQTPDGLPSGAIARKLGFSAQTGSVIARALMAQGLVLHGAPERGKVGKPTVPLILSPNGAFALGLRIGRRRSDMILMALNGDVRGRRQIRYEYPSPHQVMDFARTAFDALTAVLNPDQTARLSGVGVACPSEMWNWRDLIGGPCADMDGWRDFSFADAFAAFTDLPVATGNDATLACAAEHRFGPASTYGDFAYFTVGSFLGGGVVLGGMVQPGRAGNAGALGTIPVGGVDRPRDQLLKHASLHLLETTLTANGKSADTVWNGSEDWSHLAPELDDWIDHAARHLAVGAVAACSVFDFEAVVIDGAVPPDVRDRLCAGVARHLDGIDTQGIETPRIAAGGLGRMAGAIGAAYQPLMIRYFS